MSEDILVIKIDTLTNSFGDFKSGIGLRLEKLEFHTGEHCTEINVLKTQMELLLKIAWLIFATCGGVVIIQVLAIALKK